MVKRSRCRPLTAESGVRVPLGVPWINREVLYTSLFFTFGDSHLIVLVFRISLCIYVCSHEGDATLCSESPWEYQKLTHFMCVFLFSKGYRLSPILAIAIHSNVLVCVFECKTFTPTRYILCVHINEPLGSTNKKRM